MERRDQTLPRRKVPLASAEVDRVRVPGEEVGLDEPVAVTTVETGVIDPEEPGADEHRLPVATALRLPLH